MPKFNVIRKEVWQHVIAIEADDKADAIKKVANDEGNELFGAEYHYTLDPDVWGCEGPVDEKI